jgi:error-prone DNA polymerase
MATLPRMKPTCFYDLVVEVALIRPGPIQGDLAHPYLRRRVGEEEIAYFDDRIVHVLERTLGVPLFQEQMLEIAMVMADFTGDEAEELRKALSFHRSGEKMVKATAKLRAAMARKGVQPGVVDRIAKAVGSFALYGFPESHAISFALLAYASAYLKVHRAPEFFTALLNNQPMGFYSAATLVKDAKRHGVQIRPVCVVRSNWESRIEADGSIRLGLRQVQGVQAGHAEKLLVQRAQSPFTSLDDLKARTPLTKDELRTLAEIGALNQVSEHRRAALWNVERTRHDGDLFTEASQETPLAAMDPMERLEADYSGLRLTTGPHPMALFRASLPGVWRAADLVELKDGAWIRIAGQVICRQRPGTAKGVCFVSLEDETGIANAIVAPELFERERLKITSEPFLIIEGIAQKRQGTIHVKARKIERFATERLASPGSHDFG